MVVIVFMSCAVTALLDHSGLWCNSVKELQTYSIHITSRKTAENKLTHHWRCRKTSKLSIIPRQTPKMWLRISSTSRVVAALNAAKASFSFLVPLEAWFLLRIFHDTATAEASSSFELRAFTMKGRASASSAWLHETLSFLLTAATYVAAEHITCELQLQLQ